jgi:predicted secreted protein
MRLLLLITLLLSIPLMADAAIWTPKAAPDAPPVMVEGKTMVSLSDSEQVQVTQDRISSTLSINHEGKDPASVQEFINQKMREAVKKAENTNGVKVSTGSYQVYRSTDPNTGRPSTRWQGSQSLTLDSAGAEALLKLTGDIQQMGFATSDLSYYLSREKTESLRDELISRALETIRSRANAIGKQLGLGKIQFAQITFDNPGNPPMPKMMRAMAAEAVDTSTPPVAKAGESTVAVTVNAVVFMGE